MNMIKQRGLSLLVAMIVLVVMSIAAIGLIRSTDTGVLLAGNLAFRQSAMHATDIGVETARRWLLDNPGALTAHNASMGYYANEQNIDLTGNDPNISAKMNWSGTSGDPRARCLTATTNGNTVCYVIHRLCLGTGPLDGGTCTTKTGDVGGSSLGSTRQMSTYQQGSWASTTRFGYYRITVRVAGPRNNVSYAQSFVII
jgi:type IV pilus assembly protein PilX